MSTEYTNKEGEVIALRVGLKGHRTQLTVFMQIVAFAKEEGKFYPNGGDFGMSRDEFAEETMKECSEVVFTDRKHGELA